MSSESLGAQTSTEIIVHPEANTSTPSIQFAKEMGRISLEVDGFMVLDEVDSPHSSTREYLESHIIDQPQAIEGILEALDRAQLRPESDHRPVVNLAFLGPTGVGKSETAKALSQCMPGGQGNLIKIDCSDFSQGHEVMSLVGAPPSYVGREQSPILSKKKVEIPGTVVLFDELEKGSPQLYNLMLQIMGDGQLRLNNGDTVSFRNTAIVITSNLGAREMTKQLFSPPVGFGENTASTDSESVEKVAVTAFNRHFTPEFLNRLNKTVVFHPLSNEGLGRVLDVKVAEANRFFEDESGFRLSLSDETRAHLISIAVNEPHLGARPLIRALENTVYSTLGRYTQRGVVVEGTHVRVVHQDEMPQAEARQSSTAPLLFTAKSDNSIRKKPRVIEITAEAPEPEEAAPEEVARD